MSPETSKTLTIAGYALSLIVASLLVFAAIRPVEKAARAGSEFHGLDGNGELPARNLEMEIPDFTIPPNEEIPPPVLLSDMHPYEYKRDKNFPANPLLPAQEPLPESLDPHQGMATSTPLETKPALPKADNCVCKPAGEKKGQGSANPSTPAPIQPAAPLPPS